MRDLKIGSKDGTDRITIYKISGGETPYWIACCDGDPDRSKYACAFQRGLTRNQLKRMRDWIDKELAPQKPAQETKDD